MEQEMHKNVKKTRGKGERNIEKKPQPKQTKAKALVGGIHGQMRNGGHGHKLPNPGSHRVGEEGSYHSCEEEAVDVGPLEVGGRWWRAAAAENNPPDRTLKKRQWWRPR